MTLIVDSFLFIFGAYWFIASVINFDIWKNISIGAGLIPTFVSGLLIIILVPSLIKNIKRALKDKQDFKESFQCVKKIEFIPVLIVAACLVSNYLIGLVLTLIIMLFCWLKWIAKYSIKTSCIVTIVTMGIIYGVFKVWLRLPIPTGLLGIL